MESAVGSALAVAPDEVSAVGAARQAARLVCTGDVFNREYKKAPLKKAVPEATQLPALPASLALAVTGGSPATLIPANSALPIHGLVAIVPASALGTAGTSLDLVEIDASDPTVNSPLSIVCSSTRKKMLLTFVLSSQVSEASKIASFEFSSIPSATAVATTIDISIDGAMK